jgi:hypothetical protein
LGAKPHADLDHRPGAATAAAGIIEAQADDGTSRAEGVEPWST